jgi:hypothetical protein
MDVDGGNLVHASARTIRKVHGQEVQQIRIVDRSSNGSAILRKWV